MAKVKAYRANTSSETIKTKRESFMLSARQAGEQGHDFLMEVLCHAAPTEAGGNGHGDVTAFDNLFSDLHKSARTESINL